MKPMKKLEVLLDDFTLSLKGPKHIERLGIRNPSVSSPFARSIFSNMGLMHMVAPYFPQTIVTNFTITPQFKQLIQAMYNADAPKPAGKKAENPPIKFELRSQYHDFTDVKPNGQTSKNKIAICYSAGKDSMWNLWWAREQYGKENVLAVHLNGLNRNNGYQENFYTKRQQEAIGFPLDVVNLLNSSENRGFNVMRSRDMFMVGAAIPYAMEFGASKILIEGFAEVDPTEKFTGHEKNMKYFNKLLTKMKIPVQAAWRNDTKELDCLKDLYDNVPQWMPHVSNCFAAPHHIQFHNKGWKERAPTFPIYDSQCGSCVKCRIITVARLNYDPAMDNMSQEDVNGYLKSTLAWTRANRKPGAKPDMIEGSFLETLHQACIKYDVPFKV